MNTTFIKKFGIAMVAILIAVGFSAYKVVEQQKIENYVLNNKEYVDSPLNKMKTLPLETWYFNGLPGEENDPSKYSKIQSFECEGIPVTICKLQAPPKLSDPNEPNLDHVVNPSDPLPLQKTIHDYINSAMTNLGTTNFIIEDFRR